MKNTSRAVLGLVLFSILAICFENCSEGFTTNSASISSVCPASKLNALHSLASQNKILCRDDRNYSCESRLFGPNLAPDQFKIEHCVARTSLPFSTCMLVDVLQFNTSSALKNASQSDSKEFVVGGAFNREEIRCSIIDPDSKKALLTIEDIGYDQAIEKLYLNCLQIGGAQL